MSTQSNFRTDLQGLRAIAVLLVVVAHAGFERIEGGFIGVDIFFVISGYLITGLLLKEYAATQRIDFISFYVRRIKRLMPSLLVVILATFFFASLLLSSYEFIAKTRSSFYALTWLSNLYFAFTEVGYFADMEQQDLFLHTWSLGVEEQFYLIWPLFLLALLGVGGIFGKKRHDILWLTLAATFIASLALCLYWGAHRPLWAFYLMPARIWQFSLGALVFVSSASLNRHISAGTQTLALQIVAITTIVLAATWITASMTYPGWIALLPSIAAALIMACPAPHSGWSPLSNRALVYIGDRSYALYLWHWPVFSLAKSYGADKFWYQQAGLIVLSLMLASMSYRLVELPFWKGRFSKFSNGKSLCGAAIILFASGILLLNTLTVQHRSFQDSSNEQIALALIDMPLIYSFKCDTWYKSAEVKPCVFEGENAKKTFVFFGDSVLAQWFSLFAAIYPPPEWRIIVFTKSACPIVDEDIFYTEIGAVYDVCRTWRNAVIAALAEIKPDVVVVGNAAFHKFTEDQWTKGSARIFDKLSRSSSQVYVLLGTPRLGFDGPACLVKQVSSEQAIHDRCLGRETLEKTEQVASYLSRASESYAQVELLDFNDLVCPAGKCSAITHDGVIVFRDSRHLTDTFVKSLLGGVLGRYPGLAHSI